VLSESFGVLVAASGSHPGWGVPFALAGIGWTVVVYLLVAWHMTKSMRSKAKTPFNTEARGDLYGLQATADAWRNRIPVLKRVMALAVAWATAFTIVAILTYPGRG
jgi:hypothetical protein